MPDTKVLRQTSHSDFADGDLRKLAPKFAQSNFPKILALVEKFKEIGKEHNATSGQVALAFLLAQGDDIIPIPGFASPPAFMYARLILLLYDRSQRINYIEENFSAAQIKLTAEDLKTIRQLIAESQITGDQYPPELQAMLYADTPEL